MRLDSIQEPAL